MKRTLKIFTIFLMVSTLTLWIPIGVSANTDLISNPTIEIKSAQARVEVTFSLSEIIDLKEENSDIIFELFWTNSNGDELIYKKDKTWDGYLNSYDAYPLGEHKYSSGAIDNPLYPDEVPATTIYTSTKTSSSINVESVSAVKITVLRADGSGEEVTVYTDGTISREKINAPEPEPDPEPEPEPDNNVIDTGANNDSAYSGPYTWPWSGYVSSGVDNSSGTPDTSSANTGGENPSTGMGDPIAIASVFVLLAAAGAGLTVVKRAGRKR